MICSCCDHTMMDGGLENCRGGGGRKEGVRRLGGREEGIRFSPINSTIAAVDHLDLFFFFFFPFCGDSVHLILSKSRQVMRKQE